MRTSRAARLIQLWYKPLPQTYDGNDLTNFREILPARNWDANPYQTFWLGNQLPSFMPTDIPHAQYVRIKDQALSQAQRSGGGFSPLVGYQTGQLGTARTLGIMRALWARAQALAYQNGNA